MATRLFLCCFVVVAYVHVDLAFFSFDAFLVVFCQVEEETDWEITLVPDEEEGRGVGQGHGGCQEGERR